MRGVALAWGAFLIVATYRWEKENAGTLPPPGIYVGSSVLFTGLGALATPAPGPAAAFAWALVVAAGVTGAFSAPTSTAAMAGRSAAGGTGTAKLPPSTFPGGKTGGTTKRPAKNPAPQVAP